MDGASPNRSRRKIALSFFKVVAGLSAVVGPLAVGCNYENMELLPPPTSGTGGATAGAGGTSQSGGTGATATGGTSGSFNPTGGTGPGTGGGFPTGGAQSDWCYGSPPCPDGFECVADVWRCVEPCGSDGQCDYDLVCMTTENGQGRHCVGCVDSNDCAGEFPLCLTPQHWCVQCREDADCNGNGVCWVPGVVDSPDNRCHQCASSSDCAGNSSGPYCNRLGLCVPCLTNDDCVRAGDTEHRYCDNISAGWGSYPTYQCYACLTDDDCGELKCDRRDPNPSTRRCKYCLDDHDCMEQEGHPRCSPSNDACVECIGDLDCTGRPETPHCDVGYPDPTYQCRECTSRDHCQPEHSACCEGRCQDCCSNQECPQGQICNEDGQCVYP